MCLRQKCRHFLVPQLREVVIELSNRIEIGWRVQANDFIHIPPQPAQRVVGRYRHRQDQPCRLAPADREQGGPHGGAGGDAIVHHDCRPPHDVSR